MLLKLAEIQKADIPVTGNFPGIGMAASPYDVLPADPAPAPAPASAPAPAKAPQLSSPNPPANLPSKAEFQGKGKKPGFVARNKNNIAVAGMGTAGAIGGAAKLTAAILASRYLLKKLTEQGDQPAAQ